MRRRVVIALWFVILVPACTQATPALPPIVKPSLDLSTQTPSALPIIPTAAAMPKATTAPTTAVASPVAKTPAGATRTVAPTVAVKTSPAALKLHVTSPVDESVVDVASITITGQTIPGAVVSVNDDLADVNASGQFRIDIQLDEGPNVLEIVASDSSGSELSTILRLVYEP